MATRFWIGNDTGNEGDFATAANWADTTGASGVPASGDTIIFSNLAAEVPDGWSGASTQTVGTHFSVDDGLDQSTKNFAAIIITPEYTGNIGYDDSGIHALLCAADYIDIRGSGSYYLIGAHATAAIDEVVVNGPQAAVYLGKAATSGCELTRLVCVDGYTEVLANVDDGGVTNPDVELVQVIGANAMALIGEGNTGTLDATVVAGTLYTDSGLASLVQSGGTVYLGNAGYQNATAADVDQVYMYAGTTYWRLMGTMKGLTQFGGQMIAAGSLPKTLGDLSVNGGRIELYNGTLDLSGSQYGAITLGSGCEVVVRGEGVYKAA